MATGYSLNMNDEEYSDVEQDGCTIPKKPNETPMEIEHSSNPIEKLWVIHTGRGKSTFLNEMAMAMDTHTCLCMRNATIRVYIFIFESFEEEIDIREIVSELKQLFAEYDFTIIEYHIEKGNKKAARQRILMLMLQASNEKFKIFMEVLNQFYSEFSEKFGTSFKRFIENPDLVNTNEMETDLIIESELLKEKCKILLLTHAKNLRYASIIKREESFRGWEGDTELQGKLVYNGFINTSEKSIYKTEVTCFCCDLKLVNLEPTDAKMDFPQYHLEFSPQCLLAKLISIGGSEDVVEEFISGMVCNLFSKHGKEINDLLSEQGIEVKIAKRLGHEMDAIIFAQMRSVLKGKRNQFYRNAAELVEEILKVEEELETIPQMCELMKYASELFPQMIPVQSQHGDVSTHVSHQVQTSVQSQYGASTETHTACHTPIGGQGAARSDASSSVQESPYAEENRKILKSRLCLACVSKWADCVFVPCGHMYLCSGCSKRVTECMKCGQDVERKIKVFRG